MSIIRAFIAIDLSPEIQHRLDQVMKQLQQRLEKVPVRWVPVGNIHLTLKFLGDVSLANVEVLKKIIQAEVHGHPAFEISAGDLGAFPSLRRPRVIWVGVKAPLELNQIQRSIEMETARLGYAQEEREFSPHLTLGRVSRAANPHDVVQISDALTACKVGFLGVTRVQNVRLYRSDLNPGGAVYTPIFSAGLNQVSEQ